MTEREHCQAVVDAFAEEVRGYTAGSTAVPRVNTWILAKLLEKERAAAVADAQRADAELADETPARWERVREAIKVRLKVFDLEHEWPALSDLLKHELSRAERAERERDEAREESRFLARDSASTLAANEDVRARLAEVERERDDWVNALRVDVKHAQAERDEARDQLAEHDRIADEEVALLRAAIDLGNKQLAEVTARVAEVEAQAAAREQKLVEALAREANTYGSLNECQAFIFAAFDEHGLELHEFDDDGEIRCPQDDTCECPLAREVNRLLKGWKGAGVVTRAEETSRLVERLSRASPPRLSLDEELDDFEATIAGGRPTDGLAIDRDFAKRMMARLRVLESLVGAPVRAQSAEPSRDPFWMLYREDGGAPTYRHGTIESARQEAERLAIATGCRIFVLEAMAVATPPRVGWRNLGEGDFLSRFEKEDIPF